MAKLIDMFSDGLIIVSIVIMVICGFFVTRALRRTWRIGRHIRGIERVAAGYCPACGYDQAGRINEACTECGYTFTDAELQRLRNIAPALPKVRRTTGG